MASMYSEVAALGLSYSGSMKEEDLITELNNENAIKRSGPCHRKFEKECVCNVLDVIVLAEFSEVKGPIPLISVPTFSEELQLDLDDFILKIMSVDYQAHASGCFRFTTDTQVLQTDVIEGVHAYVHYFTLNDVAARGFVRPLCLAYISKNRSKLEQKLAWLRQNFQQVSDMMKSENRVLFLEEVSIGLQKLKDLQQRYFQWKQNMEEETMEPNLYADDAVMSSINLNQLVEQQTEYNKILQSDRSVLENKHICGVLSPWKDVFSISDQSEVDQYVSYVKLVVGNHEFPIQSQRRCDSTPELRPIAALSPFGVAIGVWYMCRIHIQLDSCDLELRGGSFLRLGEKGRKGPNGETGGLESTKAEVQEALSNSTYRKLLCQLIPASVSIPYGSNHMSEASEDEASIRPVSVNEGSSSYYSAMESANGALAPRTPTEQSAKASITPRSVLVSGKPSESPGYDSSDEESSSDSSEFVDDQVSECQEFPDDELWCKCVWTGCSDSSLCGPGNRILEFFRTFSKVAQHILYSLLTGRTVVIAGSSTVRPKVWKIISALIYFVPFEEDSKYIRWHRGILVSAHIDKYKIIGLCVPERLTVHDMISPRDKNAVTILDVNSKKILGPAYTGLLLGDLIENFDQNFLCAEALVLFLQSVFAGIHQKVYLFKALSMSPPKKKALVAKDISQMLGIKGRDIDIIKYLDKYVTL